MKYNNILCTILYALSLSACALFSPPKVDQRLTLTIPQFQKNSSLPITTSLSLARTTISPNMDSNAILVLSNNNVSQIPNLSWNGEVNYLLGYIFISAFRTSSTFTSISNDNEGIIAKYLLQTSITSWNLLIEGNTKYIMTQLYANIVNTQQRTIIAQEVWTKKIPLHRVTVQSIAKAFQESTNEFTKDLVFWTEETVTQAEKTIVSQ
ncbi:MAG: ABC-type transport auxiliary lipoprotein family protein [Desulfovibrionaceae bacterium]